MISFYAGHQPARHTPARPSGEGLRSAPARASPDAPFLGFHGAASFLLGKGFPARSRKELLQGPVSRPPLPRGFRVAHTDTRQCCCAQPRASCCARDLRTQLLPKISRASRTSRTRGPPAAPGLERRPAAPAGREVAGVPRRVETGKSHQSSEICDP